MGFLDFLARKTGGDRNGSGDPLRSLAYNTAAVGTPPIRGTYPVAGNGPHSLQTISKSHVRLLGVRPSVSASSFAVDYAAPAPGIPRIREEDEIVERPRTAPNARPLVTATPRPPKHVVTRISPPAPVPFRNTQRTGSMAALTTPRKISHDMTARASLVSSSAHSRSSSVQSAAEKRFKDILDAQSEFKPSDFRGRVKASGARDYGEDVADRNLGQNGVDLESPQVQAFYAGSSNHLDRRVSVPHDSRPDSRLSQSDSLMKPRAMSLYHHSATRPTASYPKLFIPDFVPEDIDEAADTQLPLGIAGGRSQSPSSHHKKCVPTRRELEELTRELTMVDPGLETDSSAAADDTRSSSSMAKGRLRASLNLVMQPPPIPQARPGRAPRDSIHVAKRRPGSSLAAFAVDDEYPESITFSAWNSPQRPSSRSRHPSAVDYSVPVPPRRMPSLQAFHQPVSPSASRRGSAPILPSVPPTLQKRRSAQAAMRLEQNLERLAGLEDSIVDALENCVPLPHTSSPKRPCSSDMRTRAQSLTSAPAGRMSDEISEITRPRQNSVRKWSLSSTTQNPSDAGSSVFPPRSRSGTTPGTSVDLSNYSSHPSPTETTSFGRKHSDSLGGSSSGRGKELDMAVSPTMAPAHEAQVIPQLPDHKQNQSQFNIDDYVSSDSDSDSFLGTPLFRPRGPGEEDLLFREDGYGPEATQLPGLFESACPPPDISLGGHHTTQSQTQTQISSHNLLPLLPLDRQISTTSLSSVGEVQVPRRRARYRYTLNTGAHSDSDDDEKRDDKEEEELEESSKQEREREKKKGKEEEKEKEEEKAKHPRTVHAHFSTSSTSITARGATLVIAGQGRTNASTSSAALVSQDKKEEQGDCRAKKTETETKTKTTDIAATMRLRKEIKARERAQNSLRGCGDAGSGKRKGRVSSLVVGPVAPPPSSSSGITASASASASASAPTTTV